MHHERFYTSIGVFVMGALSIALLSTVFLYKNFTHSKTQTFVMLFKGSLKGLEASTPITYRGVKIGEVRRVEITESKTGDKVIIPVYVEFFVEKALGLAKNPIRLLINHGYVADITKPNFLTGIADIELVKNEDPPAIYKQTYFHGYPLFPTRNTAEKYISIDDVLKKADTMLESVHNLVQSKEILNALKATQSAATATQTAADNFDHFTQHLDEEFPSAFLQFNQTLSKISSAADSTKNLTDYLSRYPEAILRGKQ